MNQLIEQPAILRTRHQWPSIARDLILTTLPQGSSAVSVEDIAQHYGLSNIELKDLFALPSFLTVIKAEAEKAKQAGPRAAAMYRAEMMASDMAELLWLRFKNGPGEETKDMIKFFELNMKYAGLDPSTTKEAAPAMQNNVAIQLHVPQLEKLKHIIPEIE